MLYLNFFYTKPKQTRWDIWVLLYSNVNELHVLGMCVCLYKMKENNPSPDFLKGSYWYSISIAK